MTVPNERPDKNNASKLQSATNVEAQINSEHVQKMKKSYRVRSTVAQVIATLSFSTMMMGIGLVFAMPAVIIGSLLRHNNVQSHHHNYSTEIDLTQEKFYLDTNDASWLGSIIFIIQPIGSVVSGFLQDKFGRKRCMQMVNIPQLIGWIIIYYSTSLNHLYLASVLLGLSIGFMEAPVLSYVGEMSEPRLRGTLSMLSTSSAGIGVIVEFCAGAAFNWRTTIAISSGFPLLALLSISLIPESPTWLVMKGRISDAEQALCWLRGWVHPVYVREEFLALLEYINSPGIKELANINSTDNKTAWFEKLEGLTPEKTPNTSGTFALLMKPKLYRPLRMVLIFFFVAHSVSLLGLRPFMVPIFESIGMPIDPHYLLVIIAVIQSLGCYGGTIFMSSLGKRKLGMITLLICVICCYGLSVFIYYRDFVHPWLTLTTFGLLFFASGFGVCVIPWILLSEIFPLEGRGIACGISGAACYFLGFVVSKTYINLSGWFDVHGSVFIYGTIGVAGFIYLYYALPETEGKTLEEIESCFVSKEKETRKTKDLVNDVKNKENGVHN